MKNNESKVDYFICLCYNEKVAKLNSAYNTLLSFMIWLLTKILTNI